MTYSLFALTLLAVTLGSINVGPLLAQSPANPLVGAWRLNVERTRYGASAERRLEETFDCEERAADVTCRIQGTRAGGRRVTGQFRAALDGRPHAVTGLPDIDQVLLRSAGPGVVDATFSYRDTPVFGYRAYLSVDGRSLNIVSVAPVSRSALTTVVVYERR